MTAITPEVAREILLGDPGRIRDAARDAYLREQPIEELIDWVGRATYAAALRHPRGATVLPGHVATVLEEVKRLTGA